MALLNLVRDLSDQKGITPVQFSISWLLAQKPFIVPIPGTTKLHHLTEDLGALRVKFTPAELADFRKQFEKIELIGTRNPESASQDA